jgi:dipeptidyl aminopeptidase/acylaminoacyl peptidase
MTATVTEPTRTSTIGMEQVLELRLPLEVEVSPDGTGLAFVVSLPYTRPGERPSSAIWLAERDAEPVQATSGRASDALPRFAPDGERIAFASDREHPGQMSLYLLERGLTEARPLGDVAGSVEDLQWAPDGRSLLVLAADLGSDRAGVQAATKIEAPGESEQDPKVTRPSQAWRRLLRIDAATGETVEVGPPGVQVFEFHWDGRRAVAVCADEPTESAWYDAYLALLDLDSREAERIYEPEWQIQTPRLRGDHVAFVEGFCSDRAILAGTPMALDLRSRELRVLAADLDVSWLRWRDDERLWFAGWRGLGGICGTLGLDGSHEELYSGDVTIGVRHQPRLSVSDDGSTVAAIVEGPDRPPEVVRLEAGSPRAVTALNSEAAGPLRVCDWERVTWAGRDGLELEGILARPQGSEDALPLVVLVHGGPTGLWSWQFAPYRGLPLLLAEAGYAVFLPNPRGSAGRGQEFARANLGDMGGEDLQDILSGVDSLVEAGTADGDRVGIIGGSYGGFMSAWATTQTDRFRASIPQACVSNWLSFHNTTNIGQFDVLFLDSDPYAPDGEYPRRSPVYHASKCKTPTLVMHGEVDLCTPLGQAQELYQALVEAGCETELVVYPREGHGWLEHDHQVDAWNRIRDWFDQHLEA